MSRYFDEMRAVIERHGGTVEKFIGDEVMAVFGVPTVHEDDAVRAVRAAAEGRTRLRALNEDLERDFGVSLVTRMGINTGEVVAGDPSSGQTFVTGDSVNLAKRLQQAAEPGEILIGTATYPLVKDAVTVGPARTVSLKGKAEPVAPRSLDAVDATAPGFARRLDAPLVGRDAELRVLRDAFEQAVHTRSTRLVTILGPAGIGKSRLALELGAAVRDRATVLTGRCLPYGDGITFWPLSQIVRQAGGESAVHAALAGDEDAELIADRIRGTIGQRRRGTRDLLGVSAVFRRARREAAARRHLRRHSLGGANAARPDRVPRQLESEGADAHRLPGASGPPRVAPGLGHADRGSDAHYA
jgi:hypothetical protein